jgi:hypothetical protein
MNAKKRGGSVETFCRVRYRSQSHSSLSGSDPNMVRSETIFRDRILEFFLESVSDPHTQSHPGAEFDQMKYDPELLL